MKRRITKVVNFFAFNLLFFTLYLNFIHKDDGASASIPVRASFAVYTGGSEIAPTSEKHLNKTNEPKQTESAKVSIN